MNQRKPRALSRSETMAKVKSRDTRPELVLRRAIWARGLRYRLRSALPGTRDIVFRREKVAVFVDGCFWHGCALHYRKPASNEGYWSTKLRRNVERDRRVDRELELLGWHTVRIWEHEVVADIDAVAERLCAVVASRRSF
jgi:DNA mismatch endonuclease (patch repair protein)